MSTVHPRGYYGYAQYTDGRPRLMWCERIDGKAGRSWWLDFTGTDRECYAEMERRNVYATRHDPDGLQPPAEHEILREVA